jgi:hypothetical protein
VSLGVDANGNETFVNTCDPPVPMVVSATDRPVTFSVEIIMKSLNVSAGADVVFLASVTLTETMEMKSGASLSMNGTVTLTVASIVATQNSTITAEGGASIIVTGNMTASGFLNKKKKKRGEKIVTFF